jgi:hypothetical protein
MGEFPIEVWLHATSEEVPEDEARRYWNNKESIVPDLRDRTAQFWLGETQVEIPGNRDKRGPVGRVYDLVSLRGGLPDWHLPKLDPGLETELLAAFSARTTDAPFKTADPTSFARFLAANPGRYLFTMDRLLED